jgi:competence protein ComEA
LGNGLKHFPFPGAEATTQAISETEYTGRKIASRGVRVKHDATALASGTWMNLAKIAVLGATMCGASVVPAYAQQPPPQQQYSELPAGDGKDILIRVCSKCHSPDNVIANGQDREGWENAITKMAGFGAAGTDDDFTAILDYLVKNFPGTVNVNKATAAQLESGLGLSTAEAEGVVQYREKNGDFKSIDDLKKVPDLDPKKLDAKKARLAF